MEMFKFDNNCTYISLYIIFILVLRRVANKHTNTHTHTLRRLISHRVMFFFVCRFWFMFLNFFSRLLSYWLLIFKTLSLSLCNIVCLLFSMIFNCTRGNIDDDDVLINSQLLQKLLFVIYFSRVFHWKTPNLKQHPFNAQ